MAVFYKCQICGEEHESPIAFDSKQSFDSSSLSNNAFQCTKTRKTASYDKKDMLWIELDPKKKKGKKVIQGLNFIQN